MIGRFFPLVPLAASLSLLAGCGRPFNVKGAPNFVELKEQSTYAYRVTTADGIVFGVRLVDEEKRGDLAFWTHAVTLQLRDASGYALLDTRDIHAKDGTAGKLLRFGHDEGNKPFSYWLALYMAQGRIFIVEAGGLADAMAASRPAVEQMLASVEVRCRSPFAPMLASRTCNRW